MDAARAYADELLARAAASARAFRLLDQARVDRIVERLYTTIEQTTNVES